MLGGGSAHDLFQAVLVEEPEEPFLAEPGLAENGTQRTLWQGFRSSRNDGAEQSAGDTLSQYQTMPGFSAYLPTV